MLMFKTNTYVHTGIISCIIRWHCLIELISYTYHTVLRFFIKFCLDIMHNIQTELTESALHYTYRIVSYRTVPYWHQSCIICWHCLIDIIHIHSSHSLTHCTARYEYTALHYRQTNHHSHNTKSIIHSSIHSCIIQLNN